MSRTTRRAAAMTGILAALVFTSGASASGTFVQRHVHVLATFRGPTTGQNAYYGWAVSELRDATGDGVTDLVIGEVNGGSDIRGRVWVYSGRTHHLLFERAGRAFDQNGYAVADAGDIDGDGVPDVISGAPGTGSAVGHAYVYSGATGRTIVRLHGHIAGDQFGAAVAGAGDVNHDGVPDLLVGAPGSGPGSTDPGHSYVISGRTFHVIRVLHGDRPGDSFGTATDRSDDLNGDGWVDLVRVDVNRVSYALATAEGAFGPVQTIEGTPTKSRSTSVTRLPAIPDQCHVAIGEMIFARRSELDRHAASRDYDTLPNREWLAQIRQYLDQFEVRIREWLHSEHSSGSLEANVGPHTIAEDKRDVAGPGHITVSTSAGRNSDTHSRVCG